MNNSDKPKSNMPVIIAAGAIITSVLVLYNLMTAPEYTTKHTALTHTYESSSAPAASEQESSVRSSVSIASEPEIPEDNASVPESVEQTTASSGGASEISQASSVQHTSSRTSSGSMSSSSGVQRPININTASYEELQEINRIGPVLAQRIIDYRELNGPFETWEELLEVKGIGEKILEIIKQDACL